MGWRTGFVFSIEALLELAAQDPQLVLARMRDRTAEGVVYFPDGTTGPRLPSLNRWLWDGEFAGRIELRLPEPGSEQVLHEIGHIGYEIVERKRGRGYATKALALMLDVAVAEGMSSVELITSAENLWSQRVIARNGGVRVDEFQQVERLGGGLEFRWRIDLTARF